MKAPQNITIIVGLGNPGKEYEDTYHNVGSWMIEERLAQSGASGFQKEKIFQFSKGGGLIFAKPLIFMNDSGRAVQAVLKKFNARTDNLLVIHDDSDIIVGDYKVAWGRGSAGHNGIKSIIDTLGTQDFWRLRIGIRPLPVRGKRLKAGDFVLKKISLANKKTLKQVFEKAWAEAFPS